MEYGNRRTVIHVEYIVGKNYLWTSIFMMNTMVFSMNCKELIIFSSLLYKQTNPSTYVDSGIGSI